MSADYLPLLVALAIGIWARWVQNSRNPRFGVDAGTHVMIAQAIRDRRGIPQRLHYYLLDDRFDYPPLFGVFLALFSPVWLKRNSYWINGIIDSITLLVCATAFMFLGLPPLGASLAIAAYAFNPMSFEENRHLTPRVLSILFTSGALAFAVMSSHGWGPAAFAVATVLAAAMLMLHKMGPQAYVVAALALALVVQDVAPLAVLAAGALTALVVSRGHYAIVFRGHITFLVWMYRNRSDFVAGQLSRLRGEPPATVPVRSKLTSYALGLVAWQQPWIAAALVTYLVSGTPLDEVAVAMIVWLVALWIMSLLTGPHTPFAFLGEGYRYLEYGLVPVMALFLRVQYESPMMLIPSAIAVAVSFRQVRRILHKTASESDPMNADFVRAAECLGKSGAQSVWAMPHELSTPVAMVSGVPVLASISGDGLTRAADIWPLITDVPAKIAERRGIDSVLIDERRVSEAEMGVGSWRQLCKAGPYSVYASPTMRTGDR